MKFNYLDSSARPLVAGSIAATTTPDYASFGGAKGKKPKKK